MYFDYPLEQGLRQKFLLNPEELILYFDYPLEQGLRHQHAKQKHSIFVKYFDYPLEQGLRQSQW